MPAAFLPDAWVSKLFLTLRANYGASFDRQWECPADAEPAEFARQMRAHWAQELGGYVSHPEAIAYALENLPEHAPNLPQFKAICRRAPAKAVPRLEGPKAVPDAAVMAKAMGAIQQKPNGPKAWAWALARKELWQQRNPRDVAAKDALTQAQRTMWRQALDLGTAVTAAEALAEQVPA